MPQIGQKVHDAQDPTVSGVLMGIGQKAARVRTPVGDRRIPLASLRCGISPRLKRPPNIPVHQMVMAAERLGVTVNKLRDLALCNGLTLNETIDAILEPA